MADKPKKLSTDAYKGVRDFFPADMAVQNYIFGIWKKAAESYGYEQYDASVLEPAELYRAKSGEEIVNEQTYAFIDRGEREVTLRPEMTPTVARMVAAKRRELSFPLRWYSIPNLFRYEQPQRGRVREHWQLNVDIFGVESISAEIEVINMAYDITKAYGLKDADFEIRLNNRKIMNYVTRDVFGLNEESAIKISKLIDKKQKIKPEAFEAGVREVFEQFAANQNVTPANLVTPAQAGVQDQLNDMDSRWSLPSAKTGGGNDKNKSELPNPEAAIKELLTLLNSKNFEEFTSKLPQTKEEHVGLKEIKAVIAGLERLGITNVRFDQTLMRGFDYYTGMVFEVFDLNPANRRSVFGGGRYDDLLSLFGGDKVPAVGFGAGDVIARDLMETYGTLPKKSAPAQLAIVIVGDQNTPFALDLAQSLRGKGVKVSVNLSGKKVGDQISAADKAGIPFVIAIGDEEVKNGKLRLKNLATKEEVVVGEEEVVGEINVFKK